jgi:hypothetical protein
LERHLRITMEKVRPLVSYKWNALIYF